MRHGPLLLFPVAGRLGIDLDSLAEREQGRAMAQAVQNCLLCSHQDSCQRWLADREARGLERFCPNAGKLLAAREGR